jgi:hypothetical protein
LPYRSEKQRAYLHAKEPALAARWDAQYGGKIVPSRAKKKRRRTFSPPRYR